jgi:DNA invertase Pin-like site-specific DNA recombinase
MERRRILERTQDGRRRARVALAATGKTHKGKNSLGRPKAQDEAAVAAWRRTNRASIKHTARHFRLSEATVKRYCAASAEAGHPAFVKSTAPGRRDPVPVWALAAANMLDAID